MNLHSQNPTSESARKFCVGVYFRRWFWLKRCGSHSKWPAVHLPFYRFFFLDLTWQNWFKLLKVVKVVKSCLTTVAKLLNQSCSITINNFRMLQHKYQAFHFFDKKLFSHELKILKLWWIVGKQKNSRMKISASIG